MAGDGQAARIERIEHDGTFRQLAGLLHHRRADRPPSPGRPGRCASRRTRRAPRRSPVPARSRAARYSPAMHERLALHPSDQRDRAQHQVVGGGVHRRPAGAALGLDQQDLRIDLRHDLGGDLVLQRQQIVGLAVEPPRPHHLIAGPQVEQPHRDAQPVAHPLDRAVQQEVDAEGAPDRRLVACLGGEAGQRVGRDDEHPAEPRQRRGDLLGEAGREMRLLLGGADELQRHDADMGAAAGRPDLLRAAAPGSAAVRRVPRRPSLGGGGGAGGRSGIRLPEGPRISASSFCVSGDGEASSRSASTARQRS